MNRDNLRRTEEFTNPTYVVCPKCASKATISVDDPEKVNMFSPRNLACGKCTFRDRWADNMHSPMPNYEGKDNHFKLPLWLMVSCGKNFLFAYNEEHLEFLESYIGANLRGRARNPDHGWCNRSAASRLPAWIKSKKNRALVIKGVNKLKQRASCT